MPCIDMAEKLYCTKPRAAGATLWGLLGGGHRDGGLRAVAARSGHGSRATRLRCGWAPQLMAPGAQKC